MSSLEKEVKFEYDEDFQCDLMTKTHHLSKLKHHYRLTLHRFDGLVGEALNDEIIKFLTEVQNIVDQRGIYSEWLKASL